MNTKQLILNKLKNARKESLSKKVDLGLIDNFLYDDLQGLEDEVSNLSYLSYDWFDENYEKFRDAFFVLNDVFNMGAGNQVSYLKEVEELDKVFQENKDKFERFLP